MSGQQHQRAVRQSVSISLRFRIRPQLQLPYHLHLQAANSTWRPSGQRDSARLLQPKLAIELGVSARLGNVPTKQVVGPPQHSSAQLGGPWSQVRGPQSCNDGTRGSGSS